MGTGNAPKRLAVAVLAIVVFLALPARSENPRDVIPLVEGESEFLLPSQRTADILKLERREVWRFYPTDFFGGKEVHLDFWQPCYSPPLRAGNILIVPSSGGGYTVAGREFRRRNVFYGLDLSTGRILWEVPIKGAWIRARVGRGIVYFTQPDTMFREKQVLSAFDLFTGEQLWTAPDDGYVLQAVYDNRVIVDELPYRDWSRGAFVACLDGRTGKEI